MPSAEVAPVISCRQPITISPPSAAGSAAPVPDAGVLAGVLLEVPPQATIAKVITSARVIARNFFMVLFSF